MNDKLQLISQLTDQQLTECYQQAISFWKIRRFVGLGGVEFTAEPQDFEEERLRRDQAAQELVR